MTLVPPEVLPALEVVTTNNCFDYAFSCFNYFKLVRCKVGDTSIACLRLVGFECLHKLIANTRKHLFKLEETFGSEKI